jgi:hypothetical protein
MTSQDCILKQNDKTVWLNDLGKNLLADFVDAMGSQRNAAKEVGIVENTIGGVVNNGKCAPETWEKIFATAYKPKTA